MPHALADDTPALEVAGLSVTYGTQDRTLRAVRDVSFRIARGESYGLIGESGSGKSTIAYAIMQYLRGASIQAAQLRLGDRDIRHLPPKTLLRLRGERMAMVYQDPMSALNPVLRVGEQVAEILRRHKSIPRAAAWQRAQTLFERVHLPDPATIARRYPHQLSGGQQQRVVIAMAIACEPELLIMDEPTTGLDVTTEAVILQLIAELRRDLGAAVLFISHNLAVVARVCDRVGVLYAGNLVEEGLVSQVLRAPRHPYTVGLLAATPRPDARGATLMAIPGGLPDLHLVPAGCIFRPRCAEAFDACNEAPSLRPVGASQLLACHLSDPPIASVRMGPPRHAAAHCGSAAIRLAIGNVSRSFRTRTLFGRFAAPPVRAVRDVCLSLPAGTTLAIVGESGSGKSTLARCVAGLLSPDSGQIALNGQRVAPLVQNRRRNEQRAIQFIFQNPDASLNPQHTVHEIVSRPLHLHARLRGSALTRRVAELLEAVKLGPRYLTRYSRELSGGEKQRVSIARAFAASPDVVICDEPTSALDISVQAAILNELAELQARFGTSYLFISHDLAVVRYIADEVAVMHRGEIVEWGTPRRVFASPAHPYTARLLQALPQLDPVT